MGSDKALMEVRGHPLALRVADALERAGARHVHAQGGNGPALTALGLRCVADRWPGRGPGVAVADALGRAATGSGAPHVMVVAACDHPGLDAASVSALVAALGHNDAGGEARGSVAVSVGVSGQRLHPTLSAWRTRVCAPIAQRWMDGGGSSLTSLIGAMAVGHVVAEVELDARVVHDLDSPTDVSRYDRGASRAEGFRSVKELAVDIPQIDVTSLAGHLAAGRRLFDVRQPDEYAEVHVPGAILVPLAQVPDRLDDFVGDDTVYVICRSGARSGRAVEFLRSNDIDAVNVIGGTMAWVESGAGTATGDLPG